MSILPPEDHSSQNYHHLSTALYLSAIQHSMWASMSHPRPSIKNDNTGTVAICQKHADYFQRSQEPPCPAQ